MEELGLDYLLRISHAHDSTIQELMSINLIEFDAVNGVYELTDIGKDFLTGLEADIFVEQIKEKLNE